MRVCTIACVLVIVAPHGAAAQTEARETFEKHVGDFSVHCSVGIATGRGGCTVSRATQVPIALRTRFQDDSITLEFFAIDVPWTSNSVAVQVDSAPSHTSARSQPFGLSETRTIVQEIEQGRKMRLGFPTNDKGKIDHAVVDLSRFKEAIHLARGFIKTRSSARESRMTNPQSPPANMLACVDGMAPSGTDTTAYPVTHPDPVLMILPPMNAPRNVRGSTIRLSFLVGITGGVDSVAVSGTTDAGYIASVTRTGQRYRFFPGTVGGCPSPSWYSIEVTIGGL